MPSRLPMMSSMIVARVIFLNVKSNNMPLDSTTVEHHERIAKSIWEKNSHPVRLVNSPRNMPVDAGAGSL